MRNCAAGTISETNAKSSQPVLFPVRTAVASSPYIFVAESMPRSRIASEFTFGGKAKIVNSSPRLLRPFSPDRLITSASQPYASAISFTRSVRVEKSRSKRLVSVSLIVPPSDTWSGMTLKAAPPGSVRNDVGEGVRKGDQRSMHPMKFIGGGSFS